MAPKSQGCNDLVMSNDYHYHVNEALASVYHTTRMIRSHTDTTTDPTEICDWCQWEGGVEPEQSGRSSRRSYRSEYSSGRQINNKRLTRLLQVVVFLQQQTRVKPAYLRPPWPAVLNP
ncbi:hypothetical protein YC2023_078110 [Brassica napus]